MEWRVGEIYHPDSAGYVAGEPWRYEVDSFWTSGAIDSSVYEGLTGGRMPFWAADRLSDAEPLP